MAQPTLAKIVSGLLPQSRRWLEVRGYCTTHYEDGQQVVTITPAGYVYFAAIEAGHGGVKRHDVLNTMLG